MSRGLRIEYPGAIYHVTSRGNRRGDIVIDDEDRNDFWERVRETVIRFRWEMYAAVLLTNHFHLFLRTLEANLSRGMQSLLSGYAQHWNARHDRNGHLFQGRFRSHLIENEFYFWTVSRYVHLNPCPILVAHPAHWPWSTYAGYVDPSRRCDWVAYDVLMAAWQGEFGGRAPFEHYRAYVEQSIGQPYQSPFADAIDGWILGSAEFADQIRQRLMPPARRLSSVGHRGTPLRIPELLAAVTAHFEIPAEQLACRSSRHPARVVLAYLARRYTDARLREIAALLGLSRPDCVSNVLRRAETVHSTSEVHHSILQLELELGLRC